MLSFNPFFIQMGLISFLEHLIQGRMSYKGQHDCYIFLLYVTWSAALIGFIVGYVKQSYMLTFQIQLAFMILSGLIVIPSWPIWNREQTVWLQKKTTELADVKEGKKKD
jgi:signal peptidase complex subunit 1